MTAAPATRCAGCGLRTALSGELVCRDCWEKLAFVCYGKLRHSSTAAKVVARHHEAREAHECPVCRDWHTGSDHIGAQRNRADVALMCLRLYRVDPLWLPALAASWRPPAANRITWLAGQQARAEAMA
jgi:hypothetical protein